VETASSKLPPIANLLDVPVVLGAFAGARPEPAGPALISYVPAPEAPELATIGFDEELLELAQNGEVETAELEPPAPIQPLLADNAELTPVAPATAEAIAELTPVALEAGPAVETELPLLRSRIVSGPNPKAKAEPVKEAEPAKPEAKKEQPKPEAAKPEAVRPKISIRPAEPAKSSKPDVRRPATIAARTSAAPAAMPEEKPEAAPPPKPVVIPIRKPDPALAPAAKSEPLPTLTLGGGERSSGAGMKIGAVAAGLIVVTAAAWFFLRGGATGKVDAASRGTTTDITEPLPALGGAGWYSNWGSEAAINKGKQISVFRPSMGIPDYRIELHGQIERKALGWVFRAKDPKNYYVMKLEWVKPGPEPITALIKYAVIDGKETTRTQVLLPIQNLSLTTLYRVRTDVKGNKFTTHVNDQLVDYWTDDRVKLGGAGIYVDPGERALVKTTSIAALR
jgi:hypothetical protein